MKEKDKRFIVTDIFLIVLAVLPIVFGIVLYILTKPPADGIEITGARIYFTINTLIQPLPITESQVNSWLVMLSIFWLCLFITHGIKERPDSKRQHRDRPDVFKKINLYFFACQHRSGF